MWTGMNRYLMPGDQDPEPGPSSWFAAHFCDFYYAGIAVFIQRLAGTIDGAGRWKVSASNDDAPT